MTTNDPSTFSHTSPPSARADFRWLAFVILLTALVLALRIAGPSDLDQKDQPKTVAYTADMVVHGHYIWPRDIQGYPATKPPLYNWIGVPFVMITGLWTEPILKIPTMLGGIGLVMWTWLATRKILAPASPQNMDQQFSPWAAPAIAACMFIASTTTFRLIYVARPDVLLSFFLVGGWYFANACMDSKNNQGDETSNFIAKKSDAILLWVCVGCAALTKGPPALLVLAYIPLAAKLIHGSWRAALRTGFLWGVPLAVAIFAIWFLPAYLFVPPKWGQTLYELERERLVDTTLLKYVLSFYEMPATFLSRFHLWALLFIAALVHLKPKHWLTHRTAPAILWTLLVIVFFTIPRLRRDDYLLPAYPTAAVVATWFVFEILVGSQRQTLQNRRWIIYGICIITTLYCVLSGINDFRFKSQTRERLGDHVTEFAAQIKAVVPPQERGQIVFVEMGFHQLQTLLGQNQGTAEPDASQWENARWIVQPIKRGGEGAVVISLPVPRVVDDRYSAPLGLYRVDSKK